MILEYFPLYSDYPLQVGFALLLVGHAFGDYAFQSDFMVHAKSPRHGSIWPWVLGSHCLIHGFCVALILGNVWLGLAELAAHFVIDLCKSLGLFGGKEISFHIDQALHVTCKAVWIGLFTGMLTLPI